MFGPHFRKLKEKTITCRISDFGVIKDLPEQNMKPYSPTLLPKPLYPCNFIRQQ